MTRHLDILPGDLYVQKAKHRDWWLPHGVGWTQTNVGTVFLVLSSNKASNSVQMICSEVRAPIELNRYYMQHGMMDHILQRALSCHVQGKEAL